MSLLNKLHKGLVIGVTATVMGGAVTMAVGGLNQAISIIELRTAQSLARQNPEVKIDTKTYTDKFEYNAKIFNRGLYIILGGTSYMAIMGIAFGKKLGKKYKPQPQSS